MNLATVNTGQRERMRDSAPQINEVVTFLRTHAPDALAELQGSNKQASMLFGKGRHAGGPKSTEDDPLLSLRAEASLVALRKATEICEQAVGRVRGKLQKAGSLQFFGQVLSVVASAAILTSLAARFPEGVKYVSGALALAGSLVSVYAGRIGGTVHTDAGSLFSLYKDLVDYRVQALQLLPELEIWLRQDGRSGSGAELIKQTNSLCANILRAEPRIG